MRSSKVKTLGEIIPPKLAAVYIKDPVRFVREVIFNKNWKGVGGKFEITNQQIKLLRAVANGENVSVRAGRGIGKTAALSWLILWRLCTTPEAKVVATAPSFPQLQSVLWPEVKRWLDTSVVRNCFEWTKTRMYRKDNQMSFAEPRTASREESAQGLHNEFLLIIADEATGIDDPILETLFASLTEDHNQMLMMFNPTKVNGFAYDSHHATKDDWATFAFSSEFSERVDKKWLGMMKKKYVSGETIHDNYRIHVMGEFPQGDPNAIFTIEEVYAARDREVPREGAVELGIDLAAMGDDQTVVVPRWGNYVITAQDLGMSKERETHLIAWGKTKAPETKAKILDIVTKVREFTGLNGTMRLKIDNGGLGAPIIHELELFQEEYDFEIVAVNFGGSGKNYEEHQNEATHMWFNMKDLISKVQLPYDQFLLEEMTSRQWEINEVTGKNQVESKKKFKKRFLSSPDRADALILAFADKENERTFVKSYGNFKNRTTVPAYMIESKGDHYCGLFCSATGQLSAVMLSFYGNKIGVYEAITGSAEEIASSYALKAPYTMITGNDEIFKQGDSISTKLYMNGVPVTPAFNYNQHGSIYALDNLIKEGRFVIAEECDHVKKQLATWTVDKNNAKLKESHGICYAILHVISVLLPNYGARLAPQEESFVSYGKRRRRERV